MANKKISSLTALTSVATNDLIPIVDVSDTTDAATGTTKKITQANLVADKAPIASPTFTGTVTLPVGLTGVIRADSGVVSIDSDVTDLVTGASETAAGKLEEATDAEVTAGTATGGTGFKLAVTPAKLNTRLAEYSKSTSGVSAGPASSATQTITHGLGRTPTMIRINGLGTFEGNASARAYSSSHGTYNSTGNRCVYIASDGTSANPATSTSFAIYMQLASATNFCSGVIQNVGATTFDIVWTVNSASMANAAFIWEAE